MMIKNMYDRLTPSMLLEISLSSLKLKNKKNDKNRRKQNEKNKIKRKPN